MKNNKDGNIGKMNKQERYYYWKGYYEGMFGSLKHNILLMKEQIKANMEHKKRTEQEKQNEE